jgi:uncharacterized OB-fold protein
MEPWQFSVGIDMKKISSSAIGTSETATKPIINESDLSHTYWENARKGLFVVQICASCGQSRHYPKYLCANCLSDSFHWKTIENKGTIHSWTVCHHAFHPAFKPDLPYILVSVDMNETGIRALGIWRGNSELKIGLPALAHFVNASESRVELFFESP